MIIGHLITDNNILIITELKTVYVRITQACYQSAAEILIYNIWP